MAKSGTPEFNNKKSWLKRYRQNRETREHLQEKLDSLDARMTSVSAARITDMPHGGRAMTIDDLLIKKEELTNRIESLDCRGRELQSEILEDIYLLDNPRDVDLMELYCIDCMSVSDIADQLCYSERTILRFISQSIERLTNE